MNILWKDDISLNQYPTLSEDIKTDVLIIGGGMCGILCAHRLNKLGKKVIVVDENRLSNKKTLRTTAVATSLQNVFYKDINSKSRKVFLDANQEAINEYISLAKEYDFDLEIVDSYKYSDNEEDLILEKKIIEGCGHKVDLVEKEFNKEVKKALKMENQVQFHPLKLINELSKNLKIYENTKILKIKGNKAYTKLFCIEANHIIVATGYPFLRFKGLYFSKLYQMKSYVMVVDNKKQDKFNAVGSNKKDLYYRTYGNYLLVGGHDTITGDLANGFQFIINKYKNDGKIYYQWFNQDTITLDGMPYIGRLGMFNSRLYVATGFNMWGMTGSMISSILLSDLIIGVDNDWERVFSPMRYLPIKKRIGLFGFTFKEIIQNRRYRCTHLGCGLKWNEHDKCYECPCHGTKYDESLKLLEGPGQKSVNSKKKSI